ncbi:MAG: shikimate kinase II, partial [Desulfovibrio sp.]|nr:shikimate kinase II [Desulfovibrio sp.]
LVLATGGGVILRKANRDFMAANGAVVWLKADAPCLTARLTASPAADQRPPLTNLEMEEEIRAILKEREPLYLECARHIANAENPPEQVCENIAKILRIPS